MIDASFKFRYKGTEVLLITEVFKDQTVFIMTVTNHSTKTKDVFEDFSEAFDSFSNIVKTLTKQEDA